MDIGDTVNRIAFVDAEGQLCSIAPDGTDRRVLLSDGRFCQFPAWSPDSRLIAAISSDRRSAGITITGDAPESIQAQYNGEDGPPIYLYWSPDNRHLSFIAATGDNLALYLMTSSSERRVRAYGQPFFWQFTPDGNSFLAHSDGAGEYAQLCLFATDSMAQGRELGTPGHFQTPAVSADGELLAFATLDSQEESRLIVVRSNGAPLASLEYHHGLLALDWSPHEPLLAFTHPHEPRATNYGPLQLLDATNGAVRLLVSDDVLAFFWSPDGSAIAYLTLARSPDRATRQFGAYSPLIDTSIDLRATAPLTLSLSIVDVVSAETKRLARFAPQPLFVNQFLPFFDQYARSHRIWSPDSQALVLPVTTRDGTAQIAVVPRDGSRAQIIADGAMACWSTR